MQTGEECLKRNYKQKRYLVYKIRDLLDINGSEIITDNFPYAYTYDLVDMYA